MATVLIIDDSFTARRMLSDILTAAGYEVIAAASNGEEGISLFQQYHPDIVTMDIAMPVMDGISALRLIMALDEEAKIVMVSSVTQSRKMEEALRAGAVDFIMKPFEAADILAVVNRL